jgi:hypothetical protein
MSSRRDAPTKPDSVAFEPATKREFFHASKYSDIVGVMTTTAVNTSAGSGVHPSPDSCSSFAVFSKSVVVASRKSASGSASPKLTFPSSSRSGSTPFAVNFSSVPKIEVSVMKKKLPGCSYSLPAFVVIVNGTAFSGSLASPPASMMTSKSASSGTPATTPSISS